MKIIAGEFRGRSILAPRDQSTTRPITGRVRTSVFDRLMARGLFDDEPVVDVFAGTGTLGIEALSRGASACMFVERDREAVRRLKRNIETLDIADRCEVRDVDALQRGWLDHMPRPFSEGIAVAFVDPPYAVWRDREQTHRLEALMAAMSGRVIVDGVLVLRTPKQVDVPTVDGWSEPEQTVYGSQAVALYARAVGM